MPTGQGFGRHHSVDVWRAIPLCVMSTILIERNKHAFEVVEISSLELKLFLLCSLYALS